MTDLNSERLQILRDAFEHRKKEVLQHQINIDNYKLAIEEIAEKHPTCPHMAEFKKRLTHLHDTSVIEQAKEIIMRDVIAKQLGEN
jgi:hypothetical protein